MHENYLNKYDFYKTKKILCPHCGKEHSDENFFESSIKDDGDDLTTVLECYSCQKDFLVRVDKYNQSEGYSTEPILCKKHKFNFYKKIKIEKEEYNEYCCQNCWEFKLKKLKPSGEEFSEKELQDEYFVSKKENQPLVDLQKKSGIIHWDSDFFSIQTDSPEGNRDLFLSLMKFLSKMGFSHKKENKHPLIKEYYRYGKWKELEFDADYYPNGLKVSFFQNTYPGERGAGQGKYEFDKKAKMPYLLQKRLEYVIKKSVLFLKENFSLKEKDYNQLTCHDCPDLSDPNLDTIGTINKIRANPRPKIEDYNRKDKNGNLLNNGDIKYFYNYKNILCRGEVYSNLNNMWWVLTKDEYFNKSSYELFDYNGEPVRLKNDKKTIQKHLNEAIESKNFEKCIVLRDLLKDKFGEK